MKDSFQIYITQRNKAEQDDLLSSLDKMVKSFGGESLIFLDNADIAPLLLDRPSDCSKHDFGYVGVAGGCNEYSGAPTLSAMALAALRCGAGVSRVILPKSISAYARAFAPEPTYFEVDDFSPLGGFPEAIAPLSALGVGVGWGRTADRVDALKYLLSEYTKTLIIDADGLYALSVMDKDCLKNAKPSVVLTPHLKEFSRLCGYTIEEIKADLINIAQTYARENKVVLLLKGAITAITDGEKVYICMRGCAGMATAGSGDVLLGVISGFAGYLSPINAACVGAYVCGVAGESASEKYGDYGMLSSDTIKELAFAIKKIRAKN